MRKEQIEMACGILINQTQSHLASLRRAGMDVPPEVDFHLGELHANFRVIMEVAIDNLENEVVMAKRHSNLES